MGCAPHYRIGKRSLPVGVGGALILIGILLLARASVGTPTAPSVAPTPLAIAASASLAATSGASATRDPRTPIPLGYRITIQRLGIDLPIAEGDISRDIDEQKTPEGFAFHLPGTSIPGLGSNTYLYAHARTGMFLSLWNAQPRRSGGDLDTGSARTALRDQRGPPARAARRCLVGAADQWGTAHLADLDRSESDRSALRRDRGPRTVSLTQR